MIASLGRSAFGLGLAICLSSVVSGQVILYVDDDAPAGGDGLTWSSAYRFLQDALTAARSPGSGVQEIRVAQGVYRPDRDELNPNGFGAREASFQLIDGVAIIGGYAGLGQPDPDQRDLVLHETKLSGDLLGDDEPEFVKRTDNSYHVIVADNVGEMTRLDGLLVVGGQADGEVPFDGGGGMRTNQSALLVHDCLFTDNFAFRQGGGVADFGSESSYERCTFSGNRSQDPSTFNGGSGLFASNSTPEFTDCVFRDNMGARGAGLGLTFGGPVTLTRCRFERNVSTGGAGGLNCLGSDSLTLVACRFVGNTTESDGAAILFSGRTLVVRNSSFIENQALVSGGAVSIVGANASFNACAFFANEARRGGAINYRVFFNQADRELVISNCLIAGNRSELQGGVLNVFGGRVHCVCSTLTANHSVEGGVSFSRQTLFSAPTETMFHNCVLWDNEANPVVDDGGTSSLEYSLIEGGWTGLGGNTIDADPEFVDADGPDDDLFTLEDNDYRLRPESPGVDAGSNALIPEGLLTDFDGAPRVQDGDNDGVGVVDLGAYELIADCNGNRVPDPIDVDEGGSDDCNDNRIPDECEIPACNDLPATVHVSPCGRIVGGPLDGRHYFGILIGTPGDDVIVGTPGNDIIIGVRGEDVICGNGGDDRIIDRPGHKPASRALRTPANTGR